MDDHTATATDVFPWATPTLEQIAEFDALSPEEQLDRVRQAVREGFDSGIAEQSVEDILARAKARARALRNA